MYFLQRVGIHSYNPPPSPLPTYVTKSKYASIEIEVILKDGSCLVAFHHLQFFTHWLTEWLSLNSLFKVKSRWHERWALILLSDEDP